MPVSMIGHCLPTMPAALGFLVDHAFDGLHLVGERVLKRAGQNALLADRQLDEHRRLGAGVLAVLGDREHAQRHPLGLAGIDLRHAVGDLLGLLGVLLGRAIRLIAVIDGVAGVENVVAVVVIRRLIPAEGQPAGQTAPIGPAPPVAMMKSPTVVRIATPKIVAEPMTKVAAMILELIQNLVAATLALGEPLGEVVDSLGSILREPAFAAQACRACRDALDRPGRAVLPEQGVLPGRGECRIQAAFAGSRRRLRRPLRRRPRAALMENCRDALRPPGRDKSRNCGNDSRVGRFPAAIPARPPRRAALPDWVGRSRRGFCRQSEGWRPAARKTAG